MAPTRRGLLAAAGLGAIPVGRTHAGDELHVQGRRLMAMLSGATSARRVAAAYLAGVGKTDMRRAALDLDMPAVLAPLDLIPGTTAARAWLGSRIRADFATGEVVDVDGWRLSRTEVGACLLVAGVA